MEERLLTLCVKRAASVALPSVFLMDTLLRCLYLVSQDAVFQSGAVLSMDVSQPV